MLVAASECARSAARSGGGLGRRCRVRRKPSRVDAGARELADQLGLRDDLDPAAVALEILRDREELRCATAFSTSKQEADSAAIQVDALASIGTPTLSRPASARAIGTGRRALFCRSRTPRRRWISIGSSDLAEERIKQATGHARERLPAARLAPVEIAAAGIKREPVAGAHGAPLRWRREVVAVREPAIDGAEIGRSVDEGQDAARQIVVEARSRYREYEAPVPAQQARDFGDRRLEIGNVLEH